MNTIGYFELQSSDPAREIRFYSSIFGWEFIREHNVPHEYYRIITGSIHGGLMKRPDGAVPQKNCPNAFVCSVMVDDFDGMSELIDEHGGQTAIEKFAIPGRCWQGYFTDPAGNTFGLFQVDEHAV